MNNLSRLAAAATVAACALAPGLAKASLFVPIGPQNDIPVSTVVSNWGWTECFSSPYGVPLGDDASAVISSCTGDYLMLAARRVGSDTFDVLAAALQSAVLTNTGTGDSGTTNTANGSEWYYAPLWSWGFAGLGDSVSKNQCDTNGATERDRLCWHTFSWVGGWRAGSNLDLNGSSEWEKVALVASIPQQEVPAPLPILGAAAALGFSRRLRKRLRDSRMSSTPSID
jgi:hypothetical protein